MISRPLSLLIAALLLSAEDRSASTLRHDYRDSHDGRVLAQVTARLERRELTVVIRPHGERVEQPRGYEGFRGENFWAAWEMGEGVRRGALQVDTRPAVSGDLSIIEKARFRRRVYDLEREQLVETWTKERLARAVRYRARFGPSDRRREFRTAFRMRGATRLVLRGWIGPSGGGLIAFERPLLVTLRQDPPRTIAALIEELADDSPAVRSEAQRRLIARGVAALETLRKHENDPNVERRSRVRRILREIPLREAWERLTGPDADRRAKALLELGKLVGGDPLEHIKKNPDPKYVPVLTDVVLYELDNARRLKAQDALLEVGTAKAFPALLWILRNPMDHGKKVASWLGKNGDATLLGELDRLVAGGSAAADMAVKELRKRLPGAKPAPPVEWKPVDPGGFLRAARVGRTTPERVRGLRAILTGQLLKEGGGEVLIEALQDPDEEVRFRAAEIFTFMPMKEGVGDLSGLALDGGQPLRIRQMASIALARTATPPSIETLVKALGEGPAELRITIAGALADTGRKALVGPLEKRLAAESDAKVRAALQDALGRLREGEKRR